MFPRSVIPATFAALFILSAPASAAGAGPSATPLILEIALAVAASIALALRAPAGRLLAATRRRLTPAKRQAASARARGV
jgi:hypothetical protein